MDFLVFYALYNSVSNLIDPYSTNYNITLSLHYTALTLAIIVFVKTLFFFIINRNYKINIVQGIINLFLPGLINLIYDYYRNLNILDIKNCKNGYPIICCGENGSPELLKKDDFFLKYKYNPKKRSIEIFELMEKTIIKKDSSIYLNGSSIGNIFEKYNIKNIKDVQTFFEKNEDDSKIIDFLNYIVKFKHGKISDFLNCSQQLNPLDIESFDYDNFNCYKAIEYIRRNWVEGEFENVVWDDKQTMIYSIRDKCFYNRYSYLVSDNISDTLYGLYLENIDDQIIPYVCKVGDREKGLSELFGEKFNNVNLSGVNAIIDDGLGIIKGLAHKLNFKEYITILCQDFVLIKHEDKNNDHSNMLYVDTIYLFSENYSSVMDIYAIKKEIIKREEINRDLIANNRYCCSYNNF